MVLLLLSPGFSADPDLCHRSGNPHWLLCCLIHFFFKFGGGGGRGCKETITVENHVIKLAGKYGGP